MVMLEVFTSSSACPDITLTEVTEDDRTRTKLASCHVPCNVRLLTVGCGYESMQRLLGVSMSRGIVEVVGQQGRGCGPLL